MGDLPARVSQDCEHPSAFLGVRDFEIMAGRIGDALIRCRAEKKVAVDAFARLKAAVSEKENANATQ